MAESTGAAISHTHIFNLHSQDRKKSSDESKNFSISGGRWKKPLTIAQTLLGRSVLNLHLSKDGRMTQSFFLYKQAG